jgi:hypothetical protein
MSASVTVVSVTLGLAMPSLKPSWLRWVPLGRGTDWKPSTFQLPCIAPRVCLAMSRSACITVSWWSAQICSEMSPSRSVELTMSSLGNTTIGVSLTGLLEDRP